MRQAHTIPQGRELFTLLTALSLVLFVAIVSYNNWVGFKRSNAEQDLTRRILRATATLLSTLRDAETGQRGFLLTGRENYLEPYNEALSHISQDLTELTNVTVRRPDQARRVESLKPLVDKKLAELKKTIDLRRAQEGNAALAVVLSEEGKSTMDQIRKICSEIEVVADGRLARQSEEMQSRGNQIGLISTAGAVALFVLLLLATATIQRGTYRRRRLIQDLEKSQDEIKQARDWFQTTLSGIGDAVIATDAAARVTFLNEVAQSLTGWTQKEAFGRPLDEVFVISNEESGAPAENPATKVLSEGRVGGLANHTKVTAKDGSEIQIDDSAAPIRDSHGNVTGVVLVFRDISERKHAEAERTRAEQRFRTAVSAVSDLLWTNNAKGEMEGEQPGWAGFTGQTLEAYQGYGWANAVHPDDAQPTIDAWNRAVAARQKFVFEHRVRRRDGIWRLFSICALPMMDAAGMIQEWVGVHTDITDRRQIEQALRESEQRYRLLFEQAVDGIFIADAQGRYVDVNLAGCRMVGYTREELLRFTIADLLSAEEIPRIQPELARFADGAVVTSEWRLRCKNASIVIGELVGCQLPDGRLQAIVRDITERKQIQRALEASEARLRMALVASETGTFNWNSDTGEFLNFDDNLKSLFGFAPGVPVRMTDDFLVRVHPEDITSLLAAVESAREGEGLEMEFRVIHTGGAIRWFYARAKQELDGQGDNAVLVGTCTDVTRRKQAEAVARETLERFHFMAESMPQKIFTANSKGEVNYFNREWTEYTGLTFEQIKDWGWTQFIHPDDVQENIRLWQHSVQTGEFFQLVHRFRRKDGMYRWHLSRAHAMRDDEGKLSMWIGSNTDIHEQRARELELRRANQDLESFAYSASHDLQEPLRMITAYSQMLVKGYRGQLDGEAEVCVGYITDGTKRMRELLADLLDYTAIDTKTEHKTEAIDLNQVFQEVTLSIKAAIDESGAIVFCDPLPVVNGFRAHFVQLFQNLVSNAIKYRSKLPPRIHVSVVQQEDKLLFAVADNGMGIAPQHQEKVFGVFKRLHGKKIPGTGIGLAICQRVIERYNGRIWVESALDKGATFYFTLPAVSLEVEREKA